MHGVVPRSARAQVFDEELGRKDDDRKITQQVPLTPRWNSVTIPRFRKRRWVAFLLILGVLYLFFTNLPKPLGPVSTRYDSRTGKAYNGIPMRDPRRPNEPTQNERGWRPPNASSRNPRLPPKRPFKPSPPPKLAEDASGPLHNYDGAIEFPSLSLSLQAISNSGGWGGASNILFAAGNLRSAAVLIPMVCEMAKARRNVVNFAYFGRDDLELSEILEINGVKGGCEALWHDARPEHSIHSSDVRFVKAVNDALTEIYTYLRPEVYFVTDPMTEEKAVIDGVRASSGLRFGPVIEVPANGVDKLMWMTRLDPKSLAAFQPLNIEILIDVTKEDVGGLTRLLKSIYSADYTGHRYPHITFEVPADLDIPSENAVNSFSWPPQNKQGMPWRSEKTMRRRVSHHRMTPIESAIHTVEAFYPNQPAHDHIMVLSSNVELSPMWYHYLVFNILEYAYSVRSMTHVEAGFMAGISLITPRTKVDGEQAFTPPRYTPPEIWDPDVEKPQILSPDTVPFMWQKPDTMATLYFGHKWRELHSFLSLRLKSVKLPVTRKMPQTVAPFAEPLNELMELRGWHILYPNLPAHEIAIYRPVSETREEFRTSSSRDIDPYAPAEYSPKDRKFTGSIDAKTLATTSIHTIVPNNGFLPELGILPVLNGYEIRTTVMDMSAEAATSRDNFRWLQGGCAADMYPDFEPLTAMDLFCDIAGSTYGAQRQEPDWAAISKQEEEEKASALGDAQPIEMTPGDKEQEAEIEQEFIAHLHRQGSGDKVPSAPSPKAKPAAVEAAEFKKPQKGETHEKSEKPEQPEKSAGW